MKNKTTKIITFIGTVALSLSALFVSVGSASGGNPFGANPPSFFDAIAVIPIEQIVDVNEPTVQYNNACNPFHELDVMITNNSVGLDQEFSVYIMPGNPEGIAFPIYADNHVEVASMTSVVVSFDAIPADNVDLNLLVYLNPMDIDEPLLDVSIDACPWLVILPPIEDENEDEGDEEAPVVVEGNDDNSGQDAPVEVVNNTDEGNAVFEWENITVSEATEIGRPPDPEINPEDTDDKDNDAGDSIGEPADAKINPEDTDDKKDSEEFASSEGKDSQGKSGLSILWIILIIVGGVATVGTTTRAIQKNNS